MKTFLSRATLLFFAALLLSAARVDAATVYLKARLDGAQAGVATNADGAALFSYDTTSRLLSWTVTYRNLSSALTMAHLHGPASPGTDAPIVVPLTISTSPMTGSATLTSTQEAQMLGGFWYVNLHTTNYPNGEIRGQLAVIDTNFYTANTGYPAASSPYIAGNISVDLATGQMSWQVNWGVTLLHIVSGTDFHGPATGNENAPVTVSGDSGSAMLNSAQMAELVNGFWYFQVNDINGAFRAYVLPRYPQMSSISTRLTVLTGDDVAIAGFVIEDQAKTVVITARGPSLTGSGIANPLQNPRLTLIRSSDGTVIAANDDWQTDSNSFYLTGFGLQQKESAVLITLLPGAYTAIMDGADGGTGIGIVAVTDFNTPRAPFLGISTRGQVLQGDGVMIGGFIIDGSEPKTVVVRARGPSLGVSRSLPNPMLQLVRSSDQAVIATNTDWQSAANASAIQASGFAPGNALEAAILITLSPGAYTAIVSGEGGVMGVGIVEVYAVD